MASKKVGRGRPAVYKGNVVKHIVALAAKYNASNARKILNANPKSRSAVERELAGKRNLKLVPKALGISLPTIGKFCEAASVELHRGRPAKVAA